MIKLAVGMVLAVFVAACAGGDPEAWGDPGEAGRAPEMPAMITGCGAVVCLDCIAEVGDGIWLHYYSEVRSGDGVHVTCSVHPPHGKILEQLVTHRPDDAEQECEVGRYTFTHELNTMEAAAVDIDGNLTELECISGRGD